MNNVLRNLLMAQRCAHVHHWQVKSLSMHLTLGELYEKLSDFADELAEIYMGETGETVSPDQSTVNHFSEQDALVFITQLHAILETLKIDIHEGALMSKYEELQVMVTRVKYKMENLK